MKEQAANDLGLTNNRGSVCSNSMDYPSGNCLYSCDGVVAVGPISGNELRELYKAGKIGGYSLCAEESSTEPGRFPVWLPACHLFRSIPHAIDAPKPGSSQMELLGRFSGAVVGVTAIDSTQLEPVRLEFVGVDYFSVQPIFTKSLIHYAKSALIAIREECLKLPFMISMTRARSPLQEKPQIGKIYHANREFGAAEVIAPIVLMIQQVQNTTTKPAQTVLVPVASPDHRASQGSSNGIAFESGVKFELPI